MTPSVSRRVRFGNEAGDTKILLPCVSVQKDFEGREAGHKQRAAFLLTPIFERLKQRREVILEADMRYDM